MYLIVHTKTLIHQTTFDCRQKIHYWLFEYWQMKQTAFLTEVIVYKYFNFLSLLEQIPPLTFEIDHPGIHMTVVKRRSRQCLITGGI